MVKVVQVGAGESNLCFEDLAIGEAFYLVGSPATYTGFRVKVDQGRYFWIPAENVTGGGPPGLFNGTGARVKRADVRIEMS